MTGLGRGLSAALEPWRAPRAVHDPGKIVADLAAALALGGVPGTSLCRSKLRSGLGNQIQGCWACR